MGNRYLITEVQLAMLMVTTSEEKRKKAIDKIIDTQFINNSNKDISEDVKEAQEQQLRKIRLTLGVCNKCKSKVLKELQ